MKRYEESKIEGRNPVIEAFRSGKTVDKLFLLDGCQDGPVKTIIREAKKQDTMIHFVSKERLDQMSDTKHHQGVIAVCAAYAYAQVEDLLKAAADKGPSQGSLNGAVRCGGSHAGQAFWPPDGRR